MSTKKPFKLKQTRQCEKCPWRVSTDPNTIPEGYSVDRHEQLIDTIADSRFPLRSMLAPNLRIMACHEHPSTHGVHCVGWLHNQLRPGNNIALRMAMRQCTNVQDIELRGEQHEHFLDTLPDTPIEEH